MNTSSHTNSNGVLRFLLVLLAVLALTFLTAGCRNEPVEKGVVAEVNGEPIYLAELESEYDLLHLSWSGAMSPTVGKLRKEYGQLLTGLIVRKLVFQELADHGLSISDEEVAEEEERVRSDYTDEMFDRVLIEEYIDITVWREQLRAHLAVKKLMDEIFRPNITLEFDEVDAYYRENLQGKTIPARVHFLLFAASSKEMVEKATALYLEARDLDAVEQAYPNVTVQELKVREDRLSATWNRALTDIDSGDASPAMAGMGGFESVILLERIPEKEVDTSRAYPIIEKILFDAKVQEAFARWLEEKVASSEILITSHLLPGAGADDEEEEDELAELDQDLLPVDENVDSMADLVNPELDFGRIWVVTEPGGVSVRVLNIEPAFVQGMEVEPGQYELELSLDGYQTQKERVDVFLGQDTILRLKMTKKGQGDPLAPLVEHIPITDESPVILAEEDEAMEEDVVPAAQVDPTLEYGRLFVVTEPEGGTVRVLNIGPKFEQGMELAQGVYELEVRLEGYADQLYDAEVELGYDTTVHFTMVGPGEGSGTEPEVERVPIPSPDVEGPDASESTPGDGE